MKKTVIIPNVIILYFKMDCLAQEEKRRKSELDLKKSVFLKLFLAGNFTICYFWIGLILTRLCEPWVWQAQVYFMVDAREKIWTVRSCVIN